MSGLLQSGQNMPFSDRSIITSLVSPSLADASLRGFSGPGSTLFSSHSKGFQPSTRQKTILTDSKSIPTTRRLRPNSPPHWYYPTPRGIPKGLYLNTHDVIQMPSPRQVQLFLGYIIPHIRRNINPMEVT